MWAFNPSVFIWYSILHFHIFKCKIHFYEEKCIYLLLLIILYLQVNVTITLVKGELFINQVTTILIVREFKSLYIKS